MFFVFYLVDEGIENRNTAINGPLSVHQRNAIKMAFRWRADDGPTLNAGLVAAIFQEIRTCIARKPCIFVIFQEGPDPLSLPLDPHIITPRRLCTCATYCVLAVNCFRNFHINLFGLVLSYIVGKSRIQFSAYRSCSRTFY